MSMEDIIRIDRMARENHTTYGLYQRDHPAEPVKKEPDPAVERKCPICGHRLETKKQTYCSHACSNLAWKRRKKEGC